MLAIYTEEIKYCPFCGGKIDWRNLIKGTCHCSECKAVFSVEEDDTSERIIEE